MTLNLHLAILIYRVHKSQMYLRLEVGLLRTIPTDPLLALLDLLGVRRPLVAVQGIFALAQLSEKHDTRESRIPNVR